MLLNAVEVSKIRILLLTVLKLSIHVASNHFILKFLVLL